MVRDGRGGGVPAFGLVHYMLPFMVAPFYYTANQTRWAVFYEHIPDWLVPFFAWWIVFLALFVMVFCITRATHEAKSTSTGLLTPLPPPYSLTESIITLPWPMSNLFFSPTRIWARRQVGAATRAPCIRNAMHLSAKFCLTDRMRHGIVYE